MENLPDQFTRYEHPFYNPTDFYTYSGEFNMSIFNQSLRKEQIKRLLFYRQRELERLDKLFHSRKTRLLDHTIGEHIFNMKNHTLDTIQDVKNGIQHRTLSTDIFLQETRLFYLGLLIMLIVIISLFVYVVAK